MSERTLDAALKRAAGKLAAAGLEAPRHQALVLLEHVLALDRAGVLARLREPLSAEASERYDALLARRVAHEPLQYLTGRAHFLDFELEVGPGVFIPRPETELLVERALREWPPDSRLAVDLCTGSGAIAIALALARPEASVVAIDLSPVALARAGRNARRLGVVDRVRLLRADLLSALRDGERIGLLACNPPYAPEAEVTQPEVRDHEPALAWSGGERGLDVYERIAREAEELLPPGCPMLLELGYGQETTVPELLARTGCWEPPEIAPDFQGIPRVLTTRRRGSPS